MALQKTLGEIMQPDRARDGDAGEIPTDERGLRAKLEEWDAEIERVKRELFARKLAVKPPGEAALAAAHERDLDRHLSRMMTVRGEIATRLYQAGQLRVAEQLHSDDGETRAELEKLRSYARAIVEKRVEVSDAVRAEVGREISRREVKLAMK